MLGDLNLASEGALGFAGPRVIEETIRQRLRLGFNAVSSCSNTG